MSDDVKPDDGGPSEPDMSEAGDQEYFGDGVAEVEAGCCLRHAALLVGDGDDLRHRGGIRGE